MRRNTLPSVERLNELFVYSPELGRLYRRATGEAVGHLTHQGYLRTKVDGVRTQLHRIVWKMRTGDEPPEIIDHVNGDKLDNRMGNLREADRSKNLFWQPKSIKNNSGIVGVCWEQRKHKSRGKWRPYLSVGGKQIKGGFFDDIADAAYARRMMELKYYGSDPRA